MNESILWNSIHKFMKLFFNGIKLVTSLAVLFVHKGFSFRHDLVVIADVVKRLVVTVRTNLPIGFLIVVVGRYFVLISIDCIICNNAIFK